MRRDTTVPTVRRRVLAGKRLHASRPTAERSEVTAEQAHAPPGWLLLLHQIPPVPGYLRVKVGRRLQRIGAVPLKNSVYVLPRRPQTLEDFEWVAREIVSAGGEAAICAVEFLHGVSSDDIRRRFDAARDSDYRRIVAAAKPILRRVSRAVAARPVAPERRAAVEAVLGKLERQFEQVAAVDHFSAPLKGEAARMLAELGEQLRRASTPATKERRPATVVAVGAMSGREWVIRRDVHVDRLASAWLIRRFIDPQARFRFVDPDDYQHAPHELRFDMFDAEFTHVNDNCTFETLLEAFALTDPALHALAQVVHDVDCKDAKFRRAESPGLERMIAGLAAAVSDDADRVHRADVIFSGLHAAFALSPHPPT